VTMLFSDLVGFTAICSTATPMEIISLLQSLYTQFDVLCGDLDIYKVITRAGGFAFSQSVLLSSACHHAINDPILSFCLSVTGGNHRWRLLCRRRPSPLQLHSRTTNCLDGALHAGSLPLPSDSRRSAHSGELVFLVVYFIASPCPLFVKVYNGS
jgi:hypothetical protein